MKKIKIFLFIISYSLFFLNVTNASVIPGTIKKGSNSTSTQCGISSSSYVTSNRCVTAGSCNRSCDSYHPVYHYCTSGSYKSSGGQSYRSSSTSYNNYLSRSNTIYYNGSVRLTSDVQTCTTNTTGVHSGASYGGYTYCSGSPCGSGGSGSRYNPRHGYCSRATSRETRISYFNQLGTRTYSKNNYATTQYNSSKNTNLTATCYIEGRYATSDTSAPSISVNGVRNVFANNDEERCI